MNKFPWVFWINITKRPQWFSYWWKTRGSNYIEFQVWKFSISIGMPWHQSVLNYMASDPLRGLSSAKATNEANQKGKYSFLIGRYNK